MVNIYGLNCINIVSYLHETQALLLGKAVTDFFLIKKF